MSDSVSQSPPAQGSGDRSVRIDIDEVSRNFSGVHALKGVSLTVEKGEFLALLGPSGSGKTTLLNILAGFETADGGSIRFNDRDVTRVPVHRRELGYVFQRYALFPNMTVGQNVAYPLRAKRVTRREVARRVSGALELVDLEGYETRRIDELSGGQQQRVALARALVYRPGLMLMDEPLGALDRRLRERVQLEIRALHRELGATIVYVTHDQDEAMMLADRIAVMHDGRISQVGTGRELYQQPVSRTVAGFLGDINFLPCETVAGSVGTVRVLGTQVPARTVSEQVAGEALRPVLAVRPEDVTLDSESGFLRCTVREVIFLGPTVKYIVDCQGQEISALASARTSPLVAGDTAYVSWDANAAYCFDPVGAKQLTPIP